MVVLRCRNVQVSRMEMKRVRIESARIGFLLEDGDA
jgi:hypothetical protein